MSYNESGEVIELGPTTHTIYNHDTRRWELAPDMPPYSTLTCSPCGHVVSAQYAIDRQIKMLYHWQAEHFLFTAPVFNQDTWRTGVVQSLDYTPQPRSTEQPQLAIASRKAQVMVRLIPGATKRSKPRYEAYVQLDHGSKQHRQKAYEPVQLTQDEQYAAAELSDMHCDHPLADRFRNWATNTHNGTIDKTWQVLGFRHCVVSSLYDKLYYMADQKNDKTDAYNVMLAYSIDEAQPYLWERTLLREIYATPLPPHVIDSTIMPYQKMWFTFSVPVELQYPGDQYTTKCSWMYFEKTSEGIMFVCEATGWPDNKPTYTLLGHTLEYGKRWPEDYEEQGEEQITALGQLLRMMAFINSDYVDTTSTLIPRNERKQIARTKGYEGDTDHTTGVHFVKLRPEAHAALQQYNEDTKQHRTHKDWWWVTGHNRNQWYPSLNAHQTKWIAPYKKGNLDGNIVEKIYKVTR